MSNATVFSFKEVKDMVLANYPALKSHFYKEGDMQKLKDFDALSYADNPKSPRRLTGLPERFERQLEKMHAAIDYMKSSLEMPLQESEYSETDTITATAKIAAENVNNRLSRKSEDWDAYSKPKKIVEDALNQLFVNARLARSIVSGANPGIIIARGGCAKMLFDACMREAGITPPIQPKTGRQ